MHNSAAIAATPSTGSGKEIRKVMCACSVPFDARVFCVCAGKVVSAIVWPAASNQRSSDLYWKVYNLL